jgi:tetratricopeptide (TPR) repeat protein
MSNRSPVPPRLRAKVFYFYGGRCVVTNSPLNVEDDLHHLDEHNNNHVFENLIPLSPDLNNAIERRKYRRHGIDPRLWHENLSSAARREYDLGHFQRAYACNRLGTFVCVNVYKRPNEAMTFAARALLNLRPIDSLRLSVDTLKRTVLPLLTNETLSCKIHPHSKALLGLEIGSYFRDYGLFSEADKWLALTERLADKQLYGDADLIQEIRDRIFQHRAIISIAIKDHGAAAEWFKKWKDTHEDKLYAYGSTNDVLYRVESLLSRGEFEEALDVLRKCEKTFGLIFIEPVEGSEGHVPPLYTKWTYAELKRIYADVCKQIGRKSLREKGSLLNQQGIRAFNKYNILPTNVYNSPLSPHVPRREPARLVEMRTLSEKVRRAIHQTENL